MRYNEVERAILERFVGCQLSVSAWIKFVKFEMNNGEIERARHCYERAVDNLGSDEEAEDLYEGKYCKKLDHIPKGKAVEIYNKFKKQCGVDEDGIVGKMRFQYENEVRKNPLINYDAWFDYIWLEESGGDRQRIEDVYERAIANVPPAKEKRYWKRYIYLWINYTLYEELDAQDVDHTREIHCLCLKTIPHKKISFAKIWLMAAQFEIHQLNINRALQILGSAIGMAPNNEIFKKYIEMELQLGNIKLCRTLYEKYLEWSPENCYAWSKFADLERSLGETERARAIFELAVVDQPVLDMPELLWEAYIDFEISESGYEKSIALYERLLDRTKHWRVWTSYAKFVASTTEEGFREADLSESDSEERRKCLQRARAVFEKGLSYYSTCAPELKKERATLLEEWLNMDGEQIWPA